MDSVTEPEIDLPVYARSGSGACWTIDTIFQEDFARQVEARGALLVMDALSFPWEAFAPLLDRIVLFLVLPEQLSGPEIATAFAEPMSRITFFDRVYLTRDDQAFVVNRFDLHRGQWTRFQEGMDIAALARADFTARGTPPKDGFDRESDPGAYWQERARVLSALSPELAVCSIRHSLAENKIMHLEQVGVLTDALRSVRPTRDGWRIIEFGCGIGRVLNEVRKLGAELHGVELSPHLLEICRRNLPQAACVQGDISQPDVTQMGSMDVALFVTVLHHLTAAGKLVALRNALGTLRIGGRLLLLEDFGASTKVENPITMPLTVTEVQELVAAAGGGAMILEEVRTLTYSHVLGTRTAVMMMRKVC